MPLEKLHDEAFVQSEVAGVEGRFPPDTLIIAHDRPQTLLLPCCSWTNRHIPSSPLRICMNPKIFFKEAERCTEPKSVFRYVTSPHLIVFNTTDKF
jgi:hypothetical protein